MEIVLTGETVDIVEHLCAVTGLTPSCLVALLLRKSGRELELWVSGSYPVALKEHTSWIGDNKDPENKNELNKEGEISEQDLGTVASSSCEQQREPSASPTDPASHQETPKLQLPTDLGEGLTPIEL